MNILCYIFFLLSLPLAKAQFDNYFTTQTMRVDFFHSGSDAGEYYVVDEVVKEPHWAGSFKNLVDKFDYGYFKFEIRDSLSDALIYSRGYSSLFGEYLSTKEAKSTCGNFEESIRFPFPKATVKVVFLSRTKDDKWLKKLEYYINPSTHEIRHFLPYQYPALTLHQGGLSGKCVDIVLLPDGYTADEMALFEKDCKNFTSYLLKAKPFDQNLDKINIRALEVASKDTGPGIPAENIQKETALGTSFGTFGSDRYLMTNKNKTMRDIAALVPYDQVVVLVNTGHYGGGGIYNFYSTVAARNEKFAFLALHEFGHSFAGLGDEYFQADPSNESLYSLTAEPWEPNITTLIDFKSKWDTLVADSIPVPTPLKLPYLQSIGVFEGAGYQTNGIYRPYADCTMKTTTYNNFCPVCRKAIQATIDFYAE